MRKVLIKLSAALSLFILTLLALGCQQQPPTPVTVLVTATPDIPATVTVLAEAPTDTPVPTATPIPVATPDIEATIQAGLAATIEAMPTDTPTSVPTATATPTPMATPTPIVTPIPTVANEPTTTPKKVLDSAIATATTVPQLFNNEINDTTEIREISYEFGGAGLAASEEVNVQAGYFWVFVRGKANIYFKAMARWHSKEIAAPTLSGVGFLHNYFPANNDWLGKCHLVKNWSGFLSAGANFIPAGLYSVEIWTYDDVVWESKICTSRTDLERICP